eukprot:Filipodium_phascolosomae@DN2414_c0_g1_i12.p1
MWTLVLASLLLYTFVNAEHHNSTDVSACYKASYTRVGPWNPSCPEGTAEHLGKCYESCGDNFAGIGRFCWQKCPKDMRDLGVTCAKKDLYNRGFGWPLWDKEGCKAMHKKCERVAMSWVETCKENYTPYGFMCVRKCPQRMRDDGLFCGKVSHRRGKGVKPKDCGDAKYDGGSCFEACDEGYKQYSSKCVQKCPKGYKAEKGMVCCLTKDDCKRSFSWEDDEASVKTSSGISWGVEDDSYFLQTPYFHMRSRQWWKPHGFGDASAEEIEIEQCSE